MSSSLMVDNTTLNLEAELFSFLEEWNSTSGSNHSSNKTLNDLDGDKNYWALILVVFPFLTLFGNVLVILSVYRERSLQTVTNYFIVSLALADLLVAVVVMPFAVYVLVSHRFMYFYKLFITIILPVILNVAW